MKLEYIVPATETTFQKRYVFDFKTMFGFIRIYYKAKKDNARQILIHFKQMPK